MDFCGFCQQHKRLVNDEGRCPECEAKRALALSAMIRQVRKETVGDSRRRHGANSNQ